MVIWWHSQEERLRWFLVFSTWNAPYFELCLLEQFANCCNTINCKFFWFESQLSKPLNNTKKLFLCPHISAACWGKTTNSRDRLLKAMRNQINCGTLPFTEKYSHKASSKGLSEPCIYFRKSRKICVTIWCMIDWGLPAKTMTLPANQGKRHLKEKASPNYMPGPLRVGLVTCFIFAVPHTWQSLSSAGSDSFATVHAEF